MLTNIKHTIKHTVVYSLGTVATKLIGIVLLPLYVKYITVTEYGILGILEVSIFILTQALSFGQSPSYLRLYNLEEYKQKRGTTFFTLFIFLISLICCFNFSTLFLVKPVSRFFSQPEAFAIYFRLSFFIISLRIINQLFLTNLRAREKSLLYSVGNCIKIILVLGFNIYFIAYRSLGVKGILYGYLIGEIFMFGIFFPQMIHMMIPKFEYTILKISLHFGMPLIFAGLAHMLLNMGNRYILKYLVNYSEVGLYNLGFKIAGIINVFLIHSFQASLLPIAYKIYGQRGDKRYYSKMLTYFVFILIWAGLGLSLLGVEVIEIFAGKGSDWYRSHTVIPYIILAYILSGAKMVISLGLYLKKKTNIVALLTVVALLINIGFNFLLIPKYKMIGSAVATIISFIFLYFVTYIFVNRYYKIPYENLKLLKMFVCAVILFICGSFMNPLTMTWKIGLKLLIVVLYPIFLYFFKCYDLIEIDTIKKIVKENIIKRLYLGKSVK